MKYILNGGRYASMHRLFIYLLIFFSCSSCRTQPVAENKVYKATAALSKEAQLIMQNLAQQINQTKSYDASYVELSYPNGDVPMETGVCADVVVRALRSIQVDLQKEIHEDMSGNFSSYPNNWSLSKPDKNIDHRRVPNMMKFFERKNKSVAISNVAADYLPCDIIAWKLPNNLYHIGIVSDEVNEFGVPVVIHNIGGGTKKAAVLFSWKIIGHYRWVQ